MKDVEIIGMLKTFISHTLVGMGALKGANCRIKSIVKSGDLNTVTFIWTDTDGTSKESTMLVLDGTSGIDGVSPTIVVKESTDTKYILTITDATGSFDTPNLKGGGGSGGASALSELTDVQLTSLAEGQALVYNGQKWANVDYKLSSLNDLALTDLADEDIIYYDATAQKFKNIAAGAVSDSAYTAISNLLS